MSQNPEHDRFEQEATIYVMSKYRGRVFLDKNEEETDSEKGECYDEYEDDTDYYGEIRCCECGSHAETIDENNPQKQSRIKQLKQKLGE